MLETFTSIKAHLDEVSAAVADVTRKVKEYEQQIAALKPVADSLMDIADQVNVKKSELAEVERRLKSAQDQQKRLIEALQQA
jgi:chromosome segregation ATPase